MGALVFHDPIIAFLNGAIPFDRNDRMVILKFLALQYVLGKK